jgi:hypothetical protein
MSKLPRFELSKSNSLIKPKQKLHKSVATKQKSELMKRVSTPILPKDSTMTAKKVKTEVASQPIKVVTKAVAKPVVVVAQKASAKKTPLQRAMTAPAAQPKAKAAPAQKTVSKTAMLTTKQLLSMQEKAIVSTVR